MADRKYYNIRGQEFYQEELGFGEILDLMDIMEDSRSIIKDTSDFMLIFKKVVRANTDATMRLILKSKDPQNVAPEGFFDSTPGTIGMEVIADFFSFNPPESYSHSLEKILDLFKPVMTKIGIDLSLSDIKKTLKDSFVDSQTETSQKEKKSSSKK